MGASPLFPLIVLFVMFGVTAIAKNYSATLPATQNIVLAQRNAEVSAFLSYRDAVEKYMESNPGFFGVIPFPALAALGAPAIMQSSANNAISTIGANGRLIIAYASLTPGALQFAASQSSNDASLGVATAANAWTSLAPGGQPYPLPISSIPQGAIVSVIQIGI